MATAQLPIDGDARDAQQPPRLFRLTYRQDHAATDLRLQEAHHLFCLALSTAFGVRQQRRVVMLG